MGYEEVRTYVCDKCGQKETRTAINGLNYNWEGWLTIRTNATVYHEPYRHDGIELQALYCPKCVDKHGTRTLASETALTGSEK